MLPSIAAWTMAKIFRIHALEQSRQERRTIVRGEGRIFRRRRSPFWWCEYYLHGEEFRESTKETDEKRALKYLKRRLKEVGADQIGARRFVGPRAERIKIACEVTDPAARKQNDCDCLACALERHLLLGGKKKKPRLDGKLSPQDYSILKRLHQDFAGKLATRIGADDVDAYIEDQLSEYAPSSVNRVTQYLGQAYNLAITRKRLVSDNKPDIRKLSEKDNVRQGFFERPEFLLVKPALPEYLQDLAHFGYVCGMRSGEIKSLEWATTDSESIRLRAIDAKTGKPRSVPIEGEVAEIIERRRAAQSAPWIFTATASKLATSARRGSGPV